MRGFEEDVASHNASGQTTNFQRSNESAFGSPRHFAPDLWSIRSLLQVSAAEFLSYVLQQMVSSLGSLSLKLDVCGIDKTFVFLFPVLTGYAKS